MWSYYAASHTGVVLGVRIKNGDPDLVEISKVRYAQNNEFKGFVGSDPEEEARKILGKKLSAWRHEKEVRVISRSSFVTLPCDPSRRGWLIY